MDMKQYKWGSIPWKKILMIKMREVPRANLFAGKRRIDEWIREDLRHCRILMPMGTGRITDAGYDNLACICAKIDPRYDFSVEADITVNRFLHEPGPNNQEGFGLFLRESIKRHPTIGVYYSNMAAVGGYYGRYNFFARTGILQGDVDNIENAVLYRKVNSLGGACQHDPLRYMISENHSRRFHLVLSRQGKEITAQMIGADGTDLLAPEENGGCGELTGMISADGSGRYKTEIENAFLSQWGTPFYIGFFAARGTEIVVHKDTFCFTVFGRRGRPVPGGTVRAAAMPEHVYPRRPFHPEDYASQPEQVYTVAPEGTPSGTAASKTPWISIPQLTAVG